RVLYVMDKEMVVITPKGVSLTDLEGKAVAREPQRITWSLEDAEKGGFDHFMLKEIHEAPKAIHETLLGRLANLEVDGFLSEGVTSVKLVACSSSYHAAPVGKYVFAELTRAAEFDLYKADKSRLPAEKYGNARDRFFSARYANYPVAFEGALKLKEVCYIRAEGYSAWESKDGPRPRVSPGTSRVGVAG